MTTELSAIEARTALIRVIDADLPVEISVPESPRGLVVFAACVGLEHGSPASRRAGEVLNQAGFATLSADLALQHERVVNRHTGEECGGLDLLEQRLVAITDWVNMQPEFARLPVGFFGVGTGAEAAIIAAAKRPEVAAVVAYGARLNRAEPFLKAVSAPCLFIHGNEDPALLGRERALMEKLPPKTIRQLDVIGWTTSPLHVPHGVERVTFLARDWYSRFMTNDAKLHAAAARLN